MATEHTLYKTDDVAFGPIQLHPGHHHKWSMSYQYDQSVDPCGCILEIGLTTLRAASGPGQNGSIALEPHATLEVGNGITFFKNCFLDAVCIRRSATHIFGCPPGVPETIKFEFKIDCVSPMETATLQCKMTCDGLYTHEDGVLKEGEEALFQASLTGLENHIVVPYARMVHSPQHTCCNIHFD